MNTRNTEDIIGSLYDLIQDARSMPLASDKCIIALHVLKNTIACYSLDTSYTCRNTALG